MPKLRGYEEFGVFMLGKDFNEKKGHLDQKGKSQMTILGAEFADRQPRFISQLDAKNIVAKIDTGERAQASSESFLRGLGGSYESMMTLDPKTVNVSHQNPPYRYVKLDWKRKFDKWKETYDFNKDAKKDEYKTNVDSKFIVKKGDAAYDEVTEKNKLQGEKTLDERKYLFQTGKSCKNIQEKHRNAPHLREDAKYSQVAQMFDHEVQKIKRKKGMCTTYASCALGAPLTLKNSAGKNVDYYFYGPKFKYQNLDNLAKICLYDDQANSGLDDETNPNACSKELIAACNMLTKYSSYGLGIFISNKI